MLSIEDSTFDIVLQIIKYQIYVTFMLSTEDSTFGI